LHVGNALETFTAYRRYVHHGFDCGPECCTEGVTVAPPREGIQVHWEGLSKAGNACADAERDLFPAIDAFRLGAQPTSRCFGFIEGGSSDEVAAAYQEFYNGMLGHMSLRQGALGDCSKMLRTSATAYSEAEHANTLR
jgi:hypothetical protein